MNLEKKRFYVHDVTEMFRNEQPTFRDRQTPPWPSVMPGDTFGYLAMIRSLTDVVDAFAIARLIKPDRSTNNVDDMIRPVAIMTKQTRDHQSGCYIDSEPSILFRSESGQSRLRQSVCEQKFRILKEFYMTGSGVRVYVVHGNPNDGSGDPHYDSRCLRWHKRELRKAWSGDEIQDDSLTTAVTVSKILGCALKRREEENFWRAVQARGSYLSKCMGNHPSVPTFVQDVAVFQVVTRHNPEIRGRVAREIRRRHGIPAWYNVRVSNQGCQTNQILVSISPVSRPGEIIHRWKEYVGCNHPAEGGGGHLRYNRLVEESTTREKFPIMHFSSTSQSLLQSFSPNGEPLVFCHILDPYVHKTLPNSM